MSTIAQLGVPAEAFALRETLPRVPDVEVEAERVVAHDEERVMPFVWAAGTSTPSRTPSPTNSTSPIRRSPSDSCGDTATSSPTC
ncbi:hypothetical protein [Halorussus caseinilyticus]|uniref:Uncharacterized protein n=1 Tax=Halorussus caseinilyticus TaxID=3034025 RepID=A0ABD5WP50_9EURY|nr:hypothetical protein [Halorussus sp. DT72]